MKHTKKVLEDSKELDKEYAHRSSDNCQEHAKEDLMEEFIKAIMTMNSYIANRCVKED